MEFYNLLEIPYDATAEEIRQAYFDAAKRYHPDRNPSVSDNEKFIEIQKAYDVLVDPVQRRDYDRGHATDHEKEPALKIKLMYSRSAVPIIEGKQKLYTMLDISSKDEMDPSQLPPINICLVIDRSTSMSGELLEKIKFEAINLMRMLRPEDTIAVVIFSDRAEIIVPPTKLSSTDQIVTKIHGIYANGATEIYQGLSLGVQVLRSLRINKDQIRQLVLLTDGHTYGDEEKCYTLSREANEDGISIFGIGVGKDWNDVFLDEVARLSGGDTQFVSTAQEMYSCLMDRVISAGIVLAHNVNIRFETTQDANLSFAYRCNPSVSELSIKSPIPLGNVQLRKHLQVIFEFEIEDLPISTSDIKLLSGIITMDVPSASVHRKRYFIDLHRPVNTHIEKETPPAQIVEAMSSLTLYRIQERAKESVKSGDKRKASMHLHHMATHLLAKGDRKLAHTVLKEAEYLNNNDRLSDLGEKKIKYGTRALLKLPEPEMD